MLVTTKGNNWKLFKKDFPGQTPLQIRDQYNKLKREGYLPVERCKNFSLFKLTFWMMKTQ